VRGRWVLLLHVHQHERSTLQPVVKRSSAVPNIQASAAPLPPAVNLLQQHLRRLLSSSCLPHPPAADSGAGATVCPVVCQRPRLARKEAAGAPVNEPARVTHPPPPPPPPTAGTGMRISTRTPVFRLPERLRRTIPVSQLAEYLEFGDVSARQCHEFQLHRLTPTPLPRLCRSLCSLQEAELRGAFAAACAPISTTLP